MADFIPCLYKEYEANDISQGTTLVRCEVIELFPFCTLEGEEGLIMTRNSHAFHIDAEASTQPRHARLRLPLFAQLYSLYGEDFQHG